VVVVVEDINKNQELGQLSKVTGYRLDDKGQIHGRGRNSVSASIPVMRPT
jgi:hypothetical protein